MTTPAEHAATVRAVGEWLSQMEGRTVTAADLSAILPDIERAAERATELEGRMAILGDTTIGIRAVELVCDRAEAAEARAERLHAELVEVKEATTALVKSRDKEWARAEQLETALRGLLADDDMPNHWSDCMCSYCRAIRACRAALDGGTT